MNNLTVEYIENKKKQDIISNISFSVKKNQCLGIVGESGSGKSMTCKAILGMLNSNFSVKGEVMYNHNNVLKADKNAIRKIRGKEIVMILQNPMTAFDPLLTIQSHMIETFVENLQVTKKDGLKIARESLAKMHINDYNEVLKKYPHQLSGGMLQRVMIGIALMLEPSIIIADEPTTAVDAINVMNVMDEFIRIKDHFDTSMIFISHDLGTIAKISDDILVMKDGVIADYGTKQYILKESTNEHTRYLVDTRKALINQFNNVFV